jgi:hypothetical protein
MIPVREMSVLLFINKSNYCINIKYYCKTGGWEKIGSPSVFGSMAGSFDIEETLLILNGDIGLLSIILSLWLFSTKNL